VFRTATPLGISGRVAPAGEARNKIRMLVKRERQACGCHVDFRQTAGTCMFDCG